MTHDSRNTIQQDITTLITKLTQDGMYTSEVHNNDLITLILRYIYAHSNNIDENIQHLVELGFTQDYHVQEQGDNLIIVTIRPSRTVQILKRDHIILAMMTNNEEFMLTNTGKFDSTQIKYDAYVCEEKGLSYSLIDGKITDNNRPDGYYNAIRDSLFRRTAYKLALLSDDTTVVDAGMPFNLPLHIISGRVHRVTSGIVVIDDEE